MLEEDEKFGMDERFFVGFLLDHTEITDHDRVIVMASAKNQMAEGAVIPALRKMGPFLTSKVPVGVSEHNKPVVDIPAPGRRPRSAPVGWHDGRQDNEWHPARRPGPP